MDTLLLIDRDKIQISSGGRILTLGFSPTSVKDMEIVNKDLLVNEILTFLQKNEVILGKTLVLLSEAICFISEKSSEPGAKDNFIQDFTATLPFENPTAIEVAGKFIGTNRDLYDIVVETIGKKDAIVKGVSPLFLAKEMMGKRELTQDVIDMVSANEATYSKGYFSFNIPPSPPAVIETKAKNNKATLILVGIFVTLLVILLVMVFRR